MLIPNQKNLEKSCLETKAKLETKTNICFEQKQNSESSHVYLLFGLEPLTKT